MQKKTLTDFLMASLSPLVGLQLFVLLVSGVALTWNSSIMYVTPFFILLFLSPIIYPAFLFPAGILSNIINLTSIALPRFSAFVMCLAIGYILAVMTGSAMLTFRWIDPVIQGDMFYVGVVFGAVASVAPWSTVALKDRKNVFFSGMVLFMQIATLVMSLVGVCLLKWPLKMPMMNNALLLFGVMAVLVAAQAYYEKHHPEEKEALFKAKTRADEEAAALLKKEAEQEEKNKSGGAPS